MFFFVSRYVCVCRCFCATCLLDGYSYSRTHTRSRARTYACEKQRQNGAWSVLLLHTLSSQCAHRGYYANFHSSYPFASFFTYKKKLRKTYIASILYDYSNSNSACDTGFTRRKCVIALSLHCFFFAFTHKTNTAPHCSHDHSCLRTKPAKPMDLDNLFYVLATTVAKYIFKYYIHTANVPNIGERGPPPKWKVSIMGSCLMFKPACTLSHSGHRTVCVGTYL